MRRAVAPQQAAQSFAETFPPPTGGLDASGTFGRAERDKAVVLRNWFPTTTAARVRAGLTHSATLPAAVTAMFSYRVGTNDTHFGATETGIYDITAFDPNASLTAEVSGQTSGVYSTAQIANASGDVLMYAVNGADNAQIYDGTTWQTVTDVSSPHALTGGPATSTLSHVVLHRGRFYFVERSTLNVWYLGASLASGGLSKLNLGGVFKRGGAVYFGATWSSDTGDGEDDRIVFVSTLGEVAIYSGSDPSDPSNFSLVGRYDIAPPIGPQAVLNAGGDLVIGTTEGMVPLSSVLQTDEAALAEASPTRAIEPIWRREAGTVSSTAPAQIVKWSDRGMGLCLFPDSTAGRIPVVNLLTGAWCEFTAWTANCGLVVGSKAYIGRSDGKIMSCDDGEDDDGEPYIAALVYAFQDFGARQIKRATAMRVTFQTFGSISSTNSVSRDHAVNLPAVQPSTEDQRDTAGVWDVSTWDNFSWGADPSRDNPDVVQGRWASVTGAGYYLAPTIQAFADGINSVGAEIVSVDLEFETGGVIV